MGLATRALSLRWWVAAGLIGGLVTALGAFVMYRALLFEVRTTPEAAGLTGAAVAFIAALMAALQAGLYFLAAVIASIVLRRLVASPPSLLDVFLLTVCAHAPVLVAHALSWRMLVRAERVWEAGAGQLDPELIWIRLQPSLAGDIASTIGVAALFAVLLRVARPDLPPRAIALAALAPLIVTLLAFLISVVTV